MDGTIVDVRGSSVVITLFCDVVCSGIGEVISLVCQIVVFSEVVVEDASGGKFSVVGFSIIVLPVGVSGESGGADDSTVVEFSRDVSSDAEEVVVFVPSAGTEDGSGPLVVPFIVSSLVIALPGAAVVASASGHS